MDNKTVYFFELLQIALGVRGELSRTPTSKEWNEIFIESQRQSLVGVLAGGLEHLPKEQLPVQNILIQWIGISQMINSQYQIHCNHAQDLYDFFINDGIRSCILKGVGIAQLYKYPSQRQLGDIDILVDCKRDVLLDSVVKHGLVINHVDIKHSDICFFDDVPVEVHFMPSWLYCPWNNKKLQCFFKSMLDSQYRNYNKQLGFAHTTAEFDLVYSIVHIYRHVFDEGIGLRHIIDYYYIIKKTSKNERNNASCVLQQLKMEGFVGGVMWILKNFLGIEDQFLLCPVNKRHGEFLFNEIMLMGNFGQFDPRVNKGWCCKNRFNKGIIQFKRNLRFLLFYPTEVICSPFWKLWHFGWRKRKGYL